MFDSVRAIVKLILWILIAVAAVATVIYSIIAWKAMKTWDENFKEVQRHGSPEQKKAAQQARNEIKESQESLWFIRLFKKARRSVLVYNMAADLIQDAEVVESVETEEV